jgi:hypothetical protein
MASHIDIEISIFMIDNEHKEVARVRRILCKYNEIVKRKGALAPFLSSNTLNRLTSNYQLYFSNISSRE